MAHYEVVVDGYDLLGLGWFTLRMVVVAVGNVFIRFVGFVGVSPRFVVRFVEFGGCWNAADVALADKPAEPFNGAIGSLFVGKMGGARA